MELREFVSNAIVNVCGAVVDADKKVQEIGGLVNPGTHSGKDGEFISLRTTIEFDIAVTAAETEQDSAEGGLKIYVVSAKLDSESTRTNTTVSRIQFPIDVVLPSPDGQKGRVGKVRAPRK